MAASLQDKCRKFGSKYVWVLSLARFDIKHNPDGRLKIDPAIREKWSTDLTRMMDVLFAISLTGTIPKTLEFPQILESGPIDPQKTFKDGLDVLTGYFAYSRKDKTWAAKTKIDEKNNQPTLANAIIELYEIAKEAGIQLAPMHIASHSQPARL